MYKLTLRIDDQLRTYLQQIFHSSDLERNEVLQLMFYFGSRSEDFKNFLRNYVRGNPLPSLEEGLGTWILAKKTLERIEGEECRHGIDLQQRNTRTATSTGDITLRGNDTDERPKRETTRRIGEVRDREQRRILPNTRRENGTIKISF